MIVAMRGDEELDRRAADLAGRLPEELASLARIAYNYRWCWFAGGKDVFRSIDERRWELCGENPVRLLQEVSGEALARAAGDPVLLARVASLEDAFAVDLGRPPARAAVAPERPVAFFCAEFGVHQSLPIYSGGLGALAGDLLKEASDRALPLVAVGLMYRQGYFRQRLEVTGWQQEYWIDVDPERLPAALVRAADGRPLMISLPIRGREVRAQIWRVAVGRVPLFLLDADVPENGRLERWITSQLYVADPITPPLAIRAARRRWRARARGAGDRAGACASERGARCVRGARAGARRGGARSVPGGGARGRPAAYGVHDAHAGRGRQRDLLARGRDRHGRGSRGRVGRRSRAALAIGPFPPRGRWGAVRDDDVQLADEPRGERRQPPPRRRRA